MSAERTETIPEVVDLLKRGLKNAGQPGWKVITDCRIAHVRPDIIVFNPDVGIAVFVVSDWVFDDPVRRLGSGERAIVAETSTGAWEPVPNPVGEACLHLEAIQDLFEPNEEARMKIIVRVVMPGFPVVEARNLLNRMRPSKYMQGEGKYFRIVGREQLKAGNFEAFLPDAFAENDGWRRVPPREETVARLLDEIEPPESSGGILGDPLILDTDQRDVVNNRRARRVRGAAGTGKSAVLAAAAVEAALEGRKVLLVLKTITLRHYLRSLAERWLPRGIEQEEVINAINDNVEIWYLHEWCKHVCAGAGIEKRLRALSNPNTPYSEPKIREVVADAFSIHDRSSHSEVPLFDTLLIDEAQNLDPEWFPLLLRTRSEREDRELVLMADKTQSLYSKRQDWTYDRISGGGFSGTWGTFTKSYRLPGNVVPMLADYCERFLYKRDDIDVPAPAYPEDDTNFFRCQMQWRDIRGSDDLATEIAELLHQWPDLPDLPNGDISFIVPYNALGMEVLEHLKRLDPDLADTVTHVFGEGWEIRHRLRRSFHHDSSRIFGSTLHSFQGWESRCVILGVPPLHDGGGSSGEDSFSMDYWTAVYVGLSRVARTSAGSFLVVVNAEPRLDSFLSNWFESI